MKALKRLWHKLSKLSGLKLSFLLILLAAFIVFGVRSCSENMWNEKRVYRIARDPAWYPLDLLGKERNMLAFSNELLVAIANEEGLQIDVETMGQENLFIGLNNEVYDAVLAALPPTQANAKIYLFSDPFYLLGPVLIVNVSSHVKSLDEMAGKSIGVLSGSSLVYKSDRFPTVLITSYDNILTALNDLNRNLIDGVILNNLSAYNYVTGPYAGKLKIATPPLTEEGLRLIARNHPEFEELIKSFNAGLKVLEANGTYDMLLKKWGLLTLQ